MIVRPNAGIKLMLCLTVAFTGLADAALAGDAATPKPFSRVEATAIIADARKIVTPNGIERLERVRIGGIDQWVSIRGRDKRNPVLLFIHGGPGYVSMPMSWWFSRDGVDLVGEDAEGERLVDGPVEAGEQLEQTFSTAAHQHGVIAVFIGGGGDASDRAQRADGDLAVIDQLRDVGKRQDAHGTLCLGFRFLFYTLACGGTVATRFHGSNSSMRLMGWSAIRVSTWSR